MFQRRHFDLQIHHNKQIMFSVDKRSFFYFLCLVAFTERAEQLKELASVPTELNAAKSMNCAAFGKLSVYAVY